MTAREGGDANRPTVDDGVDRSPTQPLPRTDGGLPARGGPGRVVAVMGATGGAGATTVSSGLALAWRDQHPSLVDLDFEFGDAHEAWAVPEEPTLGELVPVLDDLRTEHLQLVAHPHASGVRIYRSPSRPGGGDAWSDGNLTHLLESLRRSGPIVVDLGRAGVRIARVACELADTVVLVSPPTIRGARGVARLLGMLPERSVIVCMNRVSCDDGLTLRAFRLLCGGRVCVDLPSRPKEAADLRRGVVSTRRRSLVRRLEPIIGARIGFD